MIVSVGTLSPRSTTEVEIPRFAVRAIHWRVEEGTQATPRVNKSTFNDVVEWLLITEVSMKRRPLLEQSIAGFTAAMFLWMMDATYISRKTTDPAGDGLLTLEELVRSYEPARTEL